MKLFTSLSIVLLSGLIALQGMAMEPAPNQMPLLLSLKRQAAMKVSDIRNTTLAQKYQLSPEQKEQFKRYNQLPEELRELVNDSSTDYEVLIEFLQSSEVKNFLKQKQYSQLLLHASKCIPVLELYQWLIEHGADVNYADSNNDTALNRAVHKENMNIVRFLLNAGANVNHVGGMTALILSAGTGNANIVRLLLDARADVNLMGANRTTALRIAAYFGNAETVRCLLNVGANVHSKDEDGRTPLFFAIMRRDAEIVRLLLDAGADVNVDTARRLLERADQLNLSRLQKTKLYWVMHRKPVIIGAAGATAAAAGLGLWYWWTHKNS